MPEITIQKTLNLDLDNIPQERQRAAKQEVGEYLVNETIRYMEAGRPPVAGESSWPRLDKVYAKEEHNGDRTPTLNATGRLRDSLQFRTTDNGVEVGIFHKSQQAKADGHNNFSGNSALPQRRFVPSEQQNYKAEIMVNVERILEAYRTTRIEVLGEVGERAAEFVLTAAIDRILRGTSEDTGILSVATIVGEETLLGGEILEEFLGRRLLGDYQRENRLIKA